MRLFLPTLALCVVVSLSGCALAPTTKEIKEKKLASIYKNAGTKALMEGKFSDAIRFLRESAQRSPDDYELWNYLGIAYSKKNASKRALQSFKHALKLNKDYTLARNNLGFFYYRHKKLHKAKKLFQESLNDIEYNKHYETNFYLALIHLQQKHWADAEKALSISVKENEHYCPAWLRMSEAKIEQGKIEPAFDALEKASSGLCYSYTEAHYWFAKTLLQNHDYSDAKIKFEYIIKNFPKTSWAKQSKKQLKILARRLEK